MFRIISVLICFVSFASISVVQATDKVSKKYVDCRPEELKQAEKQFEDLVRPHLIGYAEKYNTRPKRYREMAMNRQVLFRKWLKIRCVCEPKGMSRFEKNLCKGLSDKPQSAAGASCLIRE